MMTTTARGIEEHPDVMALRMRYERAAETTPLQTIDGLGFLTGLYLAISPWVLGFAALSGLAVTNLVVGIAMAALSLGFASAFGRTHGMLWVAPLLGIWTLLAPWLVRGDVATATTIVNNVLAGAVYLVLGVAAMMVGMRRARA